MNRKAPLTIRRLDQLQQFKLYEWLKRCEFTEQHRYTDLAAAASLAIGADVSETSVQASMKILGLSLPRAKREFNAKRAILGLAVLVERLMVGDQHETQQALIQLRDVIKELE